MAEPHPLEGQVALLWEAAGVPTGVHGRVRVLRVVPAWVLLEPMDASDPRAPRWVPTERIVALEPVE